MNSHARNDEIVIFIVIDAHKYLLHGWQIFYFNEIN